VTFPWCADPGGHYSATHSLQSLTRVLSRVTYSHTSKERQLLASNSLTWLRAIRKQRSAGYQASSPALLPRCATCRQCLKGTLPKTQLSQTARTCTEIADQITRVTRVD